MSGKWAGTNFQHHRRFELPAFYREVRRILKPSGSFAAWGYDLCEFENAEANKVLEHLYNGVLGPYWSERRRLVEAQYKGDSIGLALLLRFYMYLQSSWWWRCLQD